MITVILLDSFKKIYLLIYYKYFYLKQFKEIIIYSIIKTIIIFMSITIQFSKKDYLTVEQLEVLNYSDFPTKKGQLIGNILSNYMFYVKNQLYLIDDNCIFQPIYSKDTSDKIKCIVSMLIEQSIENMDIDQYKKLEILKNKSKGVISNLTKITTISTYISFIEDAITLPDDEKLNKYNEQIHFLNGYINLKDKTFHKRTKEQRVTEVINRKYIKPSERYTKRILKELSKIYPTKEDLKTVLSIFGSALSGKSCKDQDILFLKGEGSAGKSTLLELTKKGLTDVYFMALPSNFFNVDNRDINKHMSKYLAHPKILISWINELKDSKIDTSLFKTFVEGQILFTQLFKDGTVDMTLCSKIISTLNVFPNIGMDSGSMRRIKAYQHESFFTEKTEDVDEDKHIYLKDKSLLEKLSTDKYLNAWIDILVDNASEFLNGTPIVYTKHFDDARLEIIDVNDKYQDFINKKLVITNNDEDRIDKTVMIDAYLLMHHNKFTISAGTMISQLKERKIKYSCDLRQAGCSKGCFIGVKFKTDDEDVSDNDYDCIDYVGMKPKTKEIIIQLYKKYKALKKENDELKKTNLPSISAYEKRNNDLYKSDSVKKMFEGFNKDFEEKEKEIKDKKDNIVVVSKNVSLEGIAKKKCKYLDNLTVSLF